MKKVLKVKFVDFWDGFDESDNYIIDLLKSKYDIKISETPDYIFYSCYGSEFLSYDCIRIFLTGEDLSPDFNLCDYAIGFSHIVFEDRYIRFLLPTISHADKFEMATKKHNFNYNDLKSKESFCNFVYSNGNANPKREQFYDLLSEYKNIDSGGGVRNNLGYRVGDKLEFQKKYKFSIVFENDMSSGYITEKIIHAFAAQTIPIYWGNPRASDDFNSESFINCHEYSDFKDVIKKIEELDNDDELYLKMMNENIFKNNIKPIQYDSESLLKFLISIFDREYQNSSRRSKHSMGLEYENIMKRAKKIGMSPFAKIFDRID